MPEPESKHISIRRGRNVFDTPPRVSVVIPAYNAAATIGEALDSVLAQKFREHEIIVVNDGSPDTEKLTRALNLYRENIIYIKQRNAGAGAARNTAIEYARGGIIAFLDADDVWMPEFLASQIVYLERHELDMVYCDAVLLGLNSAYRRTFMETAPSTGDANFEALLDLRCNVITSGTMARKEAIAAAGMFSAERLAAEDFDLWLRMAKNGAKIGYQRKQLLKYRVHAEGLSGDSVARVERAIEAFERVRDHMELTDNERAIALHHLAGLEADLAVEQGKAFLLRGDFREAAVAFRVANRYRRSLKLTAISALTRIAPSVLLLLYRHNRAAELAFAPKHN